MAAMTVHLNAYLHFIDNARQAMEFYHSVLGGELTMSTFGEFNASDDPAEQDKIMHSQITTDTGMVLMASDTPVSMQGTTTMGTNFSLALSGDDEPALRRSFDMLADGGSITMPLDRAPWGDTFGMCVDKFGVKWMVSVAPAA
jgi:PhnB protein